MINVIIATHGGFAEGLKESIKMLAGEFDHFHALTFSEESSMDLLREDFQEVMTEISDENQWIVLVDILGGTPFKVASEFSFKNDNVCVYYGVNLPLMIQLLLSREGKTLEELNKELLEMIPDTIGLSSI